MLPAVLAAFPADDPAAVELWDPAEEVAADVPAAVEEAMIRIRRNREKYIEQLELKLKHWYQGLRSQMQMSCCQHWLYELEIFPFARVKNTADNCSILSGSRLICCITACYNTAGDVTNFGLANTYQIESWTARLHTCVETCWRVRGWCDGLSRDELNCNSSGSNKQRRVHS